MLHLAGAKIQFIANNITTMNDNPITLNCIAIGNPLPILQWMYNNKILVSSKLMAQVMISDSIDGNIDDDVTPIHNIEPNYLNYSIEYPAPNTIEIKWNIQHYSVGLHDFDCIASNDFGQDQRRIFIERISKPIIPMETNTTFETMEGSSAFVNCDVIAHPMPDIIWLKVC